jgi:hypothetical protein
LIAADSARREAEKLTVESVIQALVFVGFSLWKSWDLDGDPLGPDCP